MQLFLLISIPWNQWPSLMKLAQLSTKIIYRRIWNEIAQIEIVGTLTAEATTSLGILQDLIHFQQNPATTS